MDFKVSIGENAGQIAIGIGKFVADVKKISGPGAQGGIAESMAIVSAAIGDLSPCFSPSDAAKAEIKAAPFSFGVALASAVVGALGL